MRPVMLIACLALAGCATAVRGPNEVLRIASTPSGARVQVSTGQSCKATPCKITLPRTADVTLTLSRFNCENAQVRVRSEISRRGATGMAGNVVLPVAGMVGVAVDGATGAARSLTPNPVEVRLRCFAPAPVSQFSAAALERAASAPGGSDALRL